MAECPETEELLFMIKKIGLNLSARLELSLKNRDLTGVQVYFLVYILRHHPDGTYLTELYHEIGVSKATLSALIKRLKEKNYLYFHEDPDDIRKKNDFSRRPNRWKPRSATYWTGRKKSSSEIWSRN